MDSKLIISVNIVVVVGVVCICATVVIKLIVLVKVGHRGVRIGADWSQMLASNVHIGN